MLSSKLISVKMLGARRSEVTADRSGGGGYITLNIQINHIGPMFHVYMFMCIDAL